MMCSTLALHSEQVKKNAGYMGNFEISGPASGPSIDGIMEDVGRY
jgi:hypothetical protein